MQRCSTAGAHASSVRARHCSAGRTHRRSSRRAACTLTAPRSPSQRRWTSCSPRPSSTSGPWRRRSSHAIPRAGPVSRPRCSRDAAESRDAARASAPVLDEAAAMTRLEQLSQMEARRDLRRAVDAAHGRDLPWILDDDVLTLGAGNGHIDLPLDALPPVADVRWPSLHDVPTAVVTGSNGKTTTVRLLAACARAHGWRNGYNCTDGLFLDGDADHRRRLLRPGRRAHGAARPTRAGGGARDRARRHPAPRSGRQPGARRRGHQRQLRSLRRIRHPRSRRARRGQARRGESARPRTGCWC